MKKHTIKIGGKTFPLAFTLDAMIMLQENIKDFDIGQLADYTREPKTLVELIYAMAAQGAYLDGHPLEEDRRWFGAHISPAPKRIVAMQIIALNALNDGMKMETEDDDAEEVDVVLEELKKKDSKAD